MPGREEGTYDDGEINAGLAESLRTKVAGWFGVRGKRGPVIGDDEVRGEWTGIMGFTGDGFPVVGELKTENGSGTGIFVSAGFNGHGMAYTWLCAEALVRIMDGKEGGEEGLESWFPEEMRLERIFRRDRKGRRVRVKRCPGQGIECALSDVV